MKTDIILDTIDEVLAMVNKDTLVVGDGIAAYNSKISDFQGANIKLSKEEEWYPRGDLLALLARQRYEVGKTDDPYKLLPLYVYKKDCQIRKKS